MVSYYSLTEEYEYDNNTTNATRWGTAQKREAKLGHAFCRKITIARAVLAALANGAYAGDASDCWCYLTAATGISLYHDSGNIEPVGNLLNPVAEHVMTTDEEIAAAEGFSNIDGLEHRQMEEAVMHGVACGTEAMALSSITLYLLYGRAHRSSRQEGSVISV